MSAILVGQAPFAQGQYEGAVSVLFRPVGLGVRRKEIVVGPAGPASPAARARLNPTYSPSSRKLVENPSLVTARR
jgi:hypothetical protein